METPRQRRKRLIKDWDDERIEQVEKLFEDLITLGSEQWTQNYTLSHNDKLNQINLMIEYFEHPAIEEYEKCQFLLDLKNDISIHRYML
jgi:hypothetical protein